jgi:hypothetical protein
MLAQLDGKVPTSHGRVIFSVRCMEGQGLITFKTGKLKLPANALPSCLLLPLYTPHCQLLHNAALLLASSPFPADLNHICSRHSHL